MVLQKVSSADAVMMSLSTVLPRPFTIAALLPGS